MFLQPRFISFLLSLFIAISTAAFCSLVPGTPTVSVATTFLVALTSSFLLIYFTIEYLIFRELFQINAIFEKLKKEDVLIHQPFESFSGVLDFLRQAVDDPTVLAIKQTIYRTGIDSELMDLLREAVRRGKGASWY